MESTFTKNKKVRLDWSSVYHRPRASTLNLIVIGIFVLAISLILATPNFLGRIYNFDIVNLREAMTLIPGVNVEVFNVQFNEETGILEVVLRRSEGLHNNQLMSNLVFEYDANIHNHSRNHQPVLNVVDLNSEFTFLYYEDLPADWGAMRISITTSHLHPELVFTMQNNEQTLDMFFLQSEVPVNNDLEKTIITSVLYGRSLGYEIQRMDSEINDELALIELNDTAINLMLSDISELERRMVRSTTDQRESILNDISNIERSIDQREADTLRREIIIQELETSREELQEIRAQFGG